MKRRAILLTTSLLLFAVSVLPSANRTYADNSRTFPETGHMVSGKFLDYWNNHGGLAQQGYPISEQVQEESDTDGKTYTMQYFERAVFEMHPENKAPYDVLLSLLGTAAYGDKYDGNAPGQKASTTNPRKFSQTAKTIGGVFRTYWEQHGGLAQQGYPISEEFQEKSATDGNTYTVQYFERAVFEYHPENAAPNNVLLSLLGTFAYAAKHGSGSSAPTPTPTSAPPLTSASLAVPGWTSVTVTRNNIALFYNATNGYGATARVNADGTLTPLQKFPDPATGNGIMDNVGFTQVVAGPNNLFLVYNASSGDARILTMGNDGIPAELAQFDFTPNWAIISIDTQTGIALFYSQVDGFVSVGLLTNDAKIGTLNNKPGTLKPGDPRLSQIVASGYGKWIFYSGTSGILSTGSINSQGVIIPAPTPFDYLANTWSNIVSNGRNLLFYDKSNGKYMTGELLSNANWHMLGSGILGKGASNFAAAPNGIVLSYSSSTGELSTLQIAGGGGVSDLKDYSPGQ